MHTYGGNRLNYTIDFKGRQHNTIETLGEQNSQSNKNIETFKLTEENDMTAYKKWEDTKTAMQIQDDITNEH